MSPEKRLVALEYFSFYCSLFCRNRPKSGQIAIEKEGPMQNMVFDAPFLDEDRVKNGYVFLIFLNLGSAQTATCSYENAYN